MMKRWFASLLITVSLLAVIPHVAYADVLVEPNNDFYTRHSNECTLLSRCFYANGEGGSVSLKKEPGSRDEVSVVENGEILTIMFTYNLRGEMWGVTEIYTANTPFDKRPTGWIPMDQLLLVYDCISFMEDHKNEFHAFTGSYETLTTAEKIVLWSWPGSGIVTEIVDKSNDDLFTISDAYTDEQNREWGFVGYWYGRRSFWVCVSDPTNNEIAAFNPPPKPELWQPDVTSTPNEAPVQPDETVIPKGVSAPWLTIVLVVAVVVGTAVLIRLFCKPGKGNSQ